MDLLMDCKKDDQTDDHVVTEMMRLNDDVNCSKQ
jgi:hypothetical protein